LSQRPGRFAISNLHLCSFFYQTTDFTPPRLTKNYAFFACRPELMYENGDEYDAKMVNLNEPAVLFCFVRSSGAGCDNAECRTLHRYLHGQIAKGHVTLALLNSHARLDAGVAAAEGV
jgi:hypothetical protein